MYLTKKHTIFGLNMPTEVPGVPSDILNPRDTWTDKEAYDNKANALAKAFINSFKNYEEYASEEIMQGAPRPQAGVPS